MSTALFPSGLTRTAWDDLQYRCKQYDEDREHWAINSDPAKGWAIRAADLIAIGAMRHIADPENYTGVAVQGWTIWGRKKYANHIPAHVEQQKAFILWASQQGIAVEARALGLEVGFPEGSVVFESLAFRDPDGKSAPVDATGLDGWTLYTGEVVAYKNITRADGTTEVTGLREDAKLWATAGSGKAPAPQPPAVKVGDRVLMRGYENVISESRIDAISPSGKYIQPSWTGNWFPVEDILEIMPPRAIEGPF